MADKLDRAGTEIEASNAQNQPVAYEWSQHYELPSDLPNTARFIGMSEVGGNGGTASEALHLHESAKVFTMLGITPRPINLNRVKGNQKTIRRS